MNQMNNSYNNQQPAGGYINHTPQQPVNYNPQNTTNSSGGKDKKKEKKQKEQKEMVKLPNNNAFKNIIILLLVIFIGSMGGLYISNEYREANRLPVEVDSNVMGVAVQEENVSEYSSVFLVNGQVYFGKITDKTDEELVMEDVYFLKVEEEANTELGNINAVDPQSQLKLVARSSTLHTPANSMTIERRNVLFTEPLANDSQVVQAIMGME